MKSGKDLIAVLLFFIIFFSNFLYSNELIYPDKEDPKALFSTSSDNNDVSLSVFGSWDLYLSGSVGMTWNSLTRQTAAAPFPGMIPGFFFKQLPDISILLYLKDRFFFETSVIGDMSFDTFLLGYDGAEDDFLKKVRIGNTDTGLSSCGILQIPDSLRNSLGLSVLAGTQTSNHELTLRYEFTEEKNKIYIGNNEVIEERIIPSNYIEGRFFHLPDPGIDDISVFIEDYNGGFTASDGRRYRAADSTDLAYSLSDGIIRFKSPLKGRALVWYSRDGLEIGNDALGNSFFHGIKDGILDPAEDPADFNWATAYMGKNMEELRITINGKDHLLIKEPGVFSPFEDLGRYRYGGTLPDENWKTGLYLAAPGAASGTELIISPDVEENIFSISAGSGSLRDPENRFPLSIIPGLYGRSPLKTLEDIGYELLLQILSESESFRIDSGAVPGSVRILKNGRMENGFTADYSSGEIKFLTAVNPADRIEIKFRTDSDDINSGEIIFGTGSNFNISPNFSVSAGSGLRWNISSANFSDRIGGSSGSLAAAAGMKFSNERITASIDGGISVFNPDTTGIFRVSGMEEGGFSLNYSGFTIFPSSIPDNIPGTGLLNRGSLFYKDYSTASVSGSSSPLHYDYPIPENQKYSYETDSIPGPYTASAGTEVPGLVMIMDYELTDQKPWAGVQIPISPGSEAPDLSDTRSIGFYWKGIDPGEDISVFLQIGAIGEDLDGDAVMDREDHIYSGGLRFDDPAAGASMLIGGGTTGTGNGIADTEDNDLDGILDSENPDLVFTEEIPPGDLPGSDWEYKQIFLSPDQRIKLGTAAFARIIVINGGTETAAGRLLFGSIKFTGSSFKASTASSGTVNAREIPETESIVPPGAGKSLTEVYSEVAGIFHSDDEQQKVLEISWSDIASGSLEVTGYPGTMNHGIYGKMDFYLRIPQLLASGAILDIAYTDTNGNGIIASFSPPVRESWEKISIDLTEKTITAGNSSVPGGQVTVSDSAGPLSRLKISLSGLGNSADTKTLYIDEIHLSETSAGLGGGCTASFRYNNPAVLFSAGTIPILGNIIFRGDGSLTGRNFGSGFIGMSDSKGITANSGLAFDLFFINLAVKGGLVYTGEAPDLSGGHTIRVPVGSEYFTLSDSFYQKQTGIIKEISRKNTVSGMVPSVFSIGAETGTTSYGENLVQFWSGNINSRWTAPFTMKIQGKLTSSASGFSPGSGNYFTNWINSYKYVLPEQLLDNRERGGEFFLEGRVSANPFNLIIKPSAAYKNIKTAETGQQNESALLLSFPLVFNEGKPITWSLTADYKRESLNSGYAAGSAFDSDISALFSSITIQDYFFRSIPFIEMADEKTALEFNRISSVFNSASYKPSLLIKISRRSGSYLHDLLLPSAFDGGITRNLVRDYDITGDSLSWHINMRSTALNLFGRRGVYPVFSFYSTDEISTSLAVASTYGDAAGNKKEIQLQNYLNFERNKDISLIIENKMKFDLLLPAFSEEARIALLWNYRPEKKPEIKIFGMDPENISKLYFTHHEQIEIKENYNKETEENTFLTKLRHDTDLVIPETGKITAFAGIGLEIKRFLNAGESEYITGFGFELGINARIGF